MLLMNSRAGMAKVIERTTKPGLIGSRFMSVPQPIQNLGTEVFRAVAALFHEEGEIAVVTLDLSAGPCLADSSPTGFFVVHRSLHRPGWAAK